MIRLTKPRVQALIDFLRKGVILKVSDWKSDYGVARGKRMKPIYCKYVYKHELTENDFPEVKEFFKKDVSAKRVIVVDNFFKVLSIVINYYESKLRQNKEEINKYKKLLHIRENF